MFSRVLFGFNKSSPVWTRLHYVALTRTINHFRPRNFVRNCASDFHTQSTVQNCRIRNDEIGEKFDSLKDINNCITYYENIQKRTRYERKNRHSVEVSMKDLAKLYPEPKQCVHSCYTRVSHELKKPSLYQVSYSSKNESEWQCEYKVSWPEENVFTAVAQNKRSAASSAAYKVLQWLHSLGKITQKGVPVVFEGDDTYKWTPLQVGEERTTEMNNLIEDYKENIREIVETELEKKDAVEFKSKLDIKIINNFNVSPIQRNKQIQARLMHRPDNSTNLPVLQYRNEIIKQLNSNQVFIIQGDTGCGKSTQVAQIIMDYYTSKNMASSCNIIVTQPRRISAISLAQRVAEERREALGDVVGYHVRMGHKLPRYPGSILFCTTGIFRNKIQHFPDLKGLSHIILDEAHVRTIDNDILHVLLKRAIKLNPDIKVIIMSATINIKQFEQYFDCPSVKIPGMLYPVEEFFMEDIIKMGIAPSSARDESSFSSEETFCDMPQIANLIQYISLEKPPGAILCFLPSWLMISKLKEMLENTYLQSVPIEIVPVHSRLSIEAQKKIFLQPPEGVRKIILATDIAETGITVPDVVYVVDSATHKHFIWDEERCTTSFVSSIVSKANIEQRKGRAGRVQPGESYHMISRETYNNLPDFPVPEILQTSLEKVVLDCKAYSDEKAEVFLSSVPDPPTITAINDAISSLIRLGAIDSNEELTNLGRRITHFAEHPTLVKSLILSRIFECVDPMLTITAAFSMSHDIFVDVLTNKSALRTVKQKYQPFSDHIAYAWIFRQSQHVQNSDKAQALKFFVANRLVPERLTYLSSLRKAIFESLYACGMIEKSLDIDNVDNEINKFSELDELVQGVLLAGTDKLLCQKKFIYVNGALQSCDGLFDTENGTKGMLSPQTVNYHRKEWPSPFLTYYRKYHMPERRAEIIRESSMISPLTVVLFGSGNIHLTKESGLVKFEFIEKSNVKIQCEEKTITAILKFRKLMWDIVQYYYKKQTSEPTCPDSDLAKVDKFKSKMLCVLARALEDTSVDKVSSKS